MPLLHGLERKRYLAIPELTRGHQIRFAQPRRPLPGAPKMSGEIGLLDHLWGRRPLSVRRGAEAAQRADRGDAHTKILPSFGPHGCVKPYCCLSGLIWVLALEHKKLQ